jgi:membrane-bound hydrogenase subunit beta
MTFPVKGLNAETGREPEELLARIRGLFGEGAVVDVRAHTAGLKEEVQYRDIWLSVDKGRFLEMIDVLAEFDFPMFYVMSGNDDGDVVTLYYHFGIFQCAGRGKRFGVAVSVALPKNDLVVPSLFSRIPGVEYSEREMREMLGITFDGLPNTALVFLPEDWDEAVKPWRRDETGPKPENVRELS